VHGSIKSHRIVAPLVGFIVALGALAPACALANPLLSGYGAPGQGNQVILGSALLNGPRGGGGNGGSAGGTVSLNAAATNGTGATAPGRDASRGSAARGGLSTAGPPRNGAGGQGAGAAAGIGKLYGTASIHVPLDSETLGLSGTDLLYIFLALGALACAGVFTRRLAGMTAREGPGS
jgi:hypothetical protein